MITNKKKLNRTIKMNSIYYRNRRNYRSHRYRTRWFMQYTWMFLSTFENGWIHFQLSSSDSQQIGVSTVSLHIMLAFIAVYWLLPLNSPQLICGMWFTSNEVKFTSSFFFFFKKGIVFFQIQTIEHRHDNVIKISLWYERCTLMSTILPAAYI